MFSTKSLCAFALAAAVASAVPFGASAKDPGCGELNMIVAGLPPYHPLVTAQGFNATAVNAALRADAVNITKAGYNLRVVLFGPEQNISVLDNQLDGVNWDGTGIGYGVRGSNLENLTVQFTSMVDLYRHRAPYAPMIFDHSPSSTLWAIQERFPLSSDCADSPGQDLGFDVFCDICST